MNTDARDPYLDALRAGALIIVVLGHWVATLPRFDEGVLVAADHLLQEWPKAGFLTWLVQVVPLFVFVSAAVAANGVEERLARRAPRGTGGQVGRCDWHGRR
ncbi:acyltransferase [Alkalisalibacterium limincola]|uniref:Acyltransferase n=1 Tax=Alkalisalibacterium limincola TaxID=2699169 RepID=A0A5C8KZ80_9GAMM|nr:acyltransferase [Alkalisalibacterium limincola]TXK64825.1 acyltransferase [Alkalisalibacterium limincola]